jgi:hypothetical protein
MKVDRVTDKPLAADRRRLFLGLPALAAGIAWPHGAFAAKYRTTPGAASSATLTHYQTKDIDGVKIFYREGRSSRSGCATRKSDRPW